MSLTYAIIAFLAASGLIAFFGYHLVNAADQLADRTGLGEALTGAVLLGAVTSLPGLITSSLAAWEGMPELAVSNAVGGIAAQTVFLAIADLAYKDANLEHAAASLSNLIQASLLIALLAVPIMAANGPSLSFGWFHPATIIMPALYIFGLRVATKSQKRPMWRPEQTSKTAEDEPDEENQDRPLWKIVLRFGVCAALVAFAGWLLARSGISLASEGGISETTVGGIFTAVSSSLPELVTTVLAARRGAQTMAVSNIIGGNAFDTLFICVADLFYRGGSIYHAIAGEQIYLIAFTILLTGFLVMGLLRREERGIANIGFESFAILVGYVLVMGFLVIAGATG